jgi:hypothetical protein
MARRTLPDADHIPIGLTVSETDAAQIDEVLTRPEFAGWSRSEWCREIVRTALRYYVGGPPAPPPAPSGEQPAPVSRTEQPASAPPRQQPAPVSPGERPAPLAPADDDGAAADGGDEPENRAQPECPHPADVRDYERGVCGACGAVIWD